MTTLNVTAEGQDRTRGNQRDNTKTKDNEDAQKNADANTKVCNLNQKTLQASDTLAEEYEIFEETIKEVSPRIGGS